MTKLHVAHPNFHSVCVSEKVLSSDHEITLNSSSILKYSWFFLFVYYSFVHKHFLYHNGTAYGILL